MQNDKENANYLQVGEVTPHPNTALTVSTENDTISYLPSDTGNTTITHYRRPYLDEVKEFNDTFNKRYSTIPTLVSKEESQFIYDTLSEELEEYMEAVESSDLSEIADAFADLLYFVMNGVLVHGLQDKFYEIFQEIHASNMTKGCKTEDEAQQTVKYWEEESGRECYYRLVNNTYVVYYKDNDKVRKSINYRRPDIKTILKKSNDKNLS